MRKLKILKLTIFTIAVLGLGVFLNAGQAQAATTYYVAPSEIGSSCTLGSECSISTAQGRANSGDTIYFTAGIYHQSITANKSGVTYEGALSGGGERLSVIDPSVAVNSASWIPAGSGVYKTNSIGFDPYAMIIDMGGETYDIARLCNPTVDAWHGGYCNGWWGELTKPSDASYTYSNIVVPYWQGIEAAYASDGTFTYVRFRDGTNPSTLNIRVSMENSGFNMFKVLNITVKNFKIRAADNGILVGSYHSGYPDEERSSDVTIQNNEILNGRIKLRIDAERVTIRDNVIHGQSYARYKAGYIPGPWIGGAAIEHGVNYHVYEYYKYPVGAGNSGRDEDGLLLMGTGSVVYNNEFYDMIDAIGAYGKDHEIYNNIIHDTPSTGFFSDGRYGSDNSSFHDNSIYNVNDSLRFGDFDGGSVGLHIYNNKIYLPIGVGRHIHYHIQVGECLDSIDNNGNGAKDYPNDSGCSSYYDNNESLAGFQTKPANGLSYIWWYHNSFSGGAEFSFVSEFVRSWTPNIMQGVKYIDNIISTSQFEHNSVDAITVGSCSYNWIYGTNLRWCSGGISNVNGAGLMWDAPEFHDFRLPNNSLGDSARNMGTDIVQPPYQLPGFSLGYAGPDGKPDMGWIDFNPADVNSDNHVNIKDIQICVKAITAPGSFITPDQLNQLAKCQAVAPPDYIVNIKDIQAIIQEIIKS